MNLKIARLLSPLCLITAIAISCGGGGGGSDSGGSGSGGGEAEDCSEDPFSVADLGGVLLLPGDQSFSRANIGANGQLLWAWDQSIGHLNSSFEFEWILDASSESGLDSRTISYTTSDAGEIFASGQTSDYGAGSVDTWVCEYSCSGAVVSGSQLAFGAVVDDTNLFLFNDVHLNQGFDLDDTTGEANIHWLNGVYSPNELDPWDIHAIVGRIDSDAGTSWARSVDLNGGGFITSRAFNAGSLSMATRIDGDDVEGYLVHLDTDGDVEWEVSTSEAFDTFALSGRLRLDDGRLLLTGSTSEDGGAKRALAVVVSETGVDWNLSLGDGGDTSFSGAVQLPGGDIIAYGSVSVVDGDPSRALIVRMQTDGTVVVQRSYGDDILDYSVDALAMMPGGALSLMAGVDFAEGWIASINQGGILQWQKHLSSDSPLGGTFELVVPDQTEFYSSSDVMVYGKKNDFGLAEDNIADVFAVIVDGPTGAVVSAHEWTGTENNPAPTVYTDENTGSLYMFAEIANPSGAGGEDGLLVRYSSGLSFVWSKLYGGESDDSIEHLDFNEDGELLISGLTNSFSSTDVDPFLLGVGLDGETSQDCWVEDVTPGTFTGVAAGSATTLTHFMGESSFSFSSVDLLDISALFDNSASHSIESTSATLDDPCD